jgi:hypothetical protein
MQSMFTLLRVTRPTLAWVESRTPRRFGLSRVINAVQSVFAAIDTCRVPVLVPVPVPRRPRVSSIALGLAAVLMVGAPLASMAQVQSTPRWNSSNFETTADGQLVDVQLMVDGQAAPLYASPRAWDRHYFQAFKGRNYAIAVRNNTGRRIGVLLSVDGLNVVNGEKSSLSRNEPMYVLDPYERTVIRGWRASLQTVRKFVFVDEQRSYAERTGQANGDMGWIRVLAFRENQPLAWGRIWDGGKRNELDKNESQPYSERGQAAPAPSEESFRQGQPQTNSRDYSGSAPSNPGTGWGDASHDPVHEVRFVAESRATDQLILRYEYETGLRALGITPVRFRNRTWDREQGQLGFAQSPRW